MDEFTYILRLNALDQITTKAAAANALQTLRAEEGKFYSYTATIYNLKLVIATYLKLQTFDAKMGRSLLKYIRNMVSVLHHNDKEFANSIVIPPLLALNLLGTFPSNHISLKGNHDVKAYFDKTNIK